MRGITVENKIFEKIKIFYFMAVAVMMYYFITQYINLGIHITYRHTFALVLAASAILDFLFRPKPNIARGITSFSCALVYSIPLFVTTIVSLFIWFMNTVETEVIARGISGSFIYTNMLSFALCAGAFLYVFGEKGIWYNLIAIITANMLMIATIIMQYGIGSFLSELITLVTTFAGVTGEIIVQAEIHELAFCLGAYLIYMLLKPQKNTAFLILLLLTSFCFITSFKRIAIIAIALALVLGYILKFIAKYHDKTAKVLLPLMSFALIFLLVGYIALIKMDAFELLEKAGINTSGRVEIYNAVDEFYEFKLDFPGNGIGFLTYQLNTNMNIEVSSVHNDFLQHFIDLGFVGYIIWLMSMTVLRVVYFGKNGRTENAIIAFVLIVYLIIVSSTDNTTNYPLLTGVLAILMTGCDYDSRVREREQKMFGYISEPNKKKESRHFL